MKLNEGVEWAIHSCAFLGALPPDKALPAFQLATYFDLPAPYLAKHLQQLSTAGIVETRKGPKGGYRLAKSPDNITLLEIVEAIDGRSPCFQCTEIRQKGPSAAKSSEYTRPCSIARAMLSAEKAWRSELRKVSLAEIQCTGVTEMPQEQLEKTASWMKDILS
ncbi:MAG: Rrf2 family transcriptional regulator [Sneathiella sp.]